MQRIRDESILELSGKLGIWVLGAWSTSMTFAERVHHLGVSEMMLTLCAVIVLYVSVLSILCSDHFEPWTWGNVLGLFTGWMAVGVGTYEQSPRIIHWAGAWLATYTMAFALGMLVAYHKRSNPITFE